MEFNQDRHFRKPAQLENGHKMVLWMGYINMHGDTQAGESGCVCVCELGTDWKKGTGEVFAECQ